MKLESYVILASHIIMSTYGFWLPNDPRGSWSDFVGAWELYRDGGRATRVFDSHSHAGKPHDVQARQRVKQALQRAPVSFTGVQARGIGIGFNHVVRRHDLTIYACCILPEHIHLIIERHEMPVERIINLLKASSTRELVREGIHPFGSQINARNKVSKMWARNGWKVYLNNPTDIKRAICYVENNPVKEGKRRQKWAFVKPYVGE